MKTLPKVIPPRSRVRLMNADKLTRSWRKDVGRRFRIGYYTRKDGLDCIWLVNDDGEYEQTTDREFLVRYFEIEHLSSETNLDGTKPPEACDKGGPNPAKTPLELLNYLRDSFTALRKSLAAITAQNMYDPIEGPYAGPNTRLGLGLVSIWHVADHYGQVVVYLREKWHRATSQPV
jgi:hypothetical protein